jgi:hypothetical protein
MTLATLPRTRAPLIIPKSPARDRVAAAAAALQHAVDALFEEAKEQARERARRDAETDRAAQARVARAKARLATKEYRIEISRKWLEEFAQDALDVMGEQAAAAGRTAETLSPTSFPTASTIWSPICNASASCERPNGGKKS